MTIIEAQVKDQELKVTTEPLVASGGINETTILFSFCENWNGFIKTAVFADAGKENWYDVVLDANKAVVPAQVTATKGKFWFGVVGVKDQTRYTTKIIQYDVAEGVTLAEEDVEPPQTLIDQLMAAVGTALAEYTQISDSVNRHTADIAEHTADIADLKSNVSLYSKRLANLEAGIPGVDFVENTENAYVKYVPTNALPYAEIVKIGGMTYQDGDTLKDAKVTEIEIGGANLFGGEVLANKIKAEASGAVLDTTAKTIRYTASNISEKVLFTSFKPNTQYTFIFKGLASAKSSNLMVTYTDGTTGNIPQFATANTVGVLRLVTNAAKSVKSLIGIWSSGTSTLYYDECGIFEGAIAADEFKPYTVNTFPIPEAVQALEGYGREGSYIEWVDDTVQFKVTKDENLEDLAEPIITDISDILSADNFIEVEGGGTLTFKNEYEYDVPSTVVYQVESEVNV